MTPPFPVAVAAGCFAGAYLAPAVPVGWAVAGALASVAVASAIRAPLVVAVGAFLVAGCLGARAWSGVEPADPSDFAGSVTLASDPQRHGPSVRAQVRTGQGRLDAWFHRGAAGTVSKLLAGERLSVTGRVTPRPEGADWLAVRHVVGRLHVQHAEVAGESRLAWRLANRLRRSLERGATGLTPARRAVLFGVVVGDDRAQSAVVVDDFRAAGLSHLTAVSGTHVAHVLVAAGPLLRRLGPRGRLLATLGVLAGFALVTRFEPSVLRATTMAALATGGMVLGRPGPAMRNLAGAVCILVLVDPLLAHSVGFQLSVAASAGILVLGRPVKAALAGPRWFVEPLAVTIAAQAAVAPLLLGVFGGIPVASLPANVLAAHAVGPLTIWGITAGILAGALPPTMATLVHLPTGLLADWLLGVTRWSTALHLGELGWAEWVAVTVTAAMVVWRRQPEAAPPEGDVSGLPGRDSRRDAGPNGGVTSDPDASAPPGRLGVLGCAALGALLVAAAMPAVRMRQELPVRSEPSPGVTVWQRGATVVVVDAEARPPAALRDLRRAGVRRMDVLVLTTTAHAPRETVAALADRYGPPVLWAPEGVHPGEQPVGGQRLGVGGLEVTVEVGDRSLEVHVARRETAQRSIVTVVLASARAPPPGPDTSRRHHPGGRDGHLEPHPRLLLRRRRLLRVRRLPGQGRATRGRRG
jgi:competence protein ComEC